MNLKNPLSLGALAGFLGLAVPAQAVNVLVETDPATFALGGGAIHLRLRPDSSLCSYGIGAYALDFPSLMVDLHQPNRKEDWKVSIQPGIGLFADRGFGIPSRHWTLGMQAGIQRFSVEAPGQEGSDGYWNLLVMPRAGFHWAPFQNGFYLFPWAGVGYTRTISGTSGDFDVSPVVPFATLHMGWQF